MKFLLYASSTMFFPQTWKLQRQIMAHNSNFINYGLNQQRPKLSRKK
ncbi:unnamed protein product [Paramecium sonneborni]|uniref:Uncharacterized protein n=1 Tax=Paramecium sonneborni TaxID=65129 RepID=A0A8S1RAX5_9CILI|nr:unnamed protein product [Paramecium sonneborni]